LRGRSCSPSRHKLYGPSGRSACALTIVRQPNLLGGFDYAEERLV
jgi:hypothetical protein